MMPFFEMQDILRDALKPENMSMALPLMVIIATISLQWIVFPNNNAERNGNPERMTFEEKTRERLGQRIDQLREAASKDKKDLRETDRTIQCQREDIERLERRVAADNKSLSGHRDMVQTVQRQREDVDRLEHRVADQEELLNWQKTMISIKDNAILNKDCMTRQLKGSLAESNTHVRNLQWDVESLEAQVEDKDELLWLTAGRGTAAFYTIEDLHNLLDRSVKVLSTTVDSDLAAIDRLEGKYTKIIAQLSDKLEDSERRLHKETGDSQILRNCIADEVPHLIECVKHRDAALRNSMDKSNRLATDLAALTQEAQREQREQNAERAELAEQLATAKAEISSLEIRVGESDKRYDAALGRVREANVVRDNAVHKMRSAMSLMRRLRDRSVQLEKDLKSESKAREQAEGYVDVEENDSHEDEESDSDEDSESGSEEGDDGEEGQFETLEVIEGREPVEGEEGFEFVEAE